jgi:dienelactone hydrolase
MQTVDRFKTSFHLPILFLLLLVLFSVQNTYGQQTSPLWGEFPAGRYQVGFKVIQEKDFSRSSLKKSGEKFIPAAREIKISVWYPAKDSGAKQPKMKFSEYVSAMDGAKASDAAKNNGQNRFMKMSLVQELPEAAIANLLQTETAALKDALPKTDEKFPVIIFGQGLYYESPITHTILCEFLAAQGFIIATTKLAGTHSPFVKLDAVDLEANVRDLEFVASRARSLENTDKERLAVVGFDMGGLAGLILTMRNTEVDAYASLDSGILAAHNLRLVKAMPDYDPLRLRVPLFHATHPVEELARFNVSEDAEFMDSARYSDRLILRFPDVRHADFTSRPMIESIAAKIQDERTAHRKRSFEAAAQNLLAFLKAHLRDDSKSLGSLYVKSATNPIQKLN